MKTWELCGKTLEFIEETHTYLVDGIVVPSVTELISDPDKYKNVPFDVLEKARKRGNEIHEAIEKLVNLGEYDPIVSDFVMIRQKEGFETIGAELPVIVFRNNIPFAAGRLDLFIANKNGYGLADVKTTSKLDIPFLTKQLNLYRIGFQQCYGFEIKFLCAIHIRNGAKYKEIEIKDLEELL